MKCKLIAALAAVVVFLLICGGVASGIHVKHKTGRVLMRKAEVAEPAEGTEAPVEMRKATPTEEEPQVEEPVEETEPGEEPQVEEPVEEMEPQPPPTTETDLEGTEIASGQEDEGNPQEAVEEEKTASQEADRAIPVADQAAVVESGAESLVNHK